MNSLAHLGQPRTRLEDIMQLDTPTQSLHQRLGHISTSTRSLFNTLTETHKKHTKNKQTITFLTKCKHNHITPFFISKLLTHINILKTDNNKHNNKIDTIISKTEKSLLNTVIEQKHEYNNKLDSCITSQTNLLYSQIQDPALKLECQNHIKRIAEQYNNTIKNKQKQKFTKLLTHNQKALTNTYKLNKKWISNLTNTHIPDNIQYLLSLGPKFSHTDNIKQNHIYDLIKDTENIIDSLPEDTDKKNEIRGKFSNIITNTINNKEKTPTHKHDKYIHTALQESTKFLKQNPHLTILPADKGNTTVIMDKTVYSTKIHELLQDTNTYTLIPKYKSKDKQRDPTSNKQSKHNTLISQLHEEGVIDKTTKTKLTTYTSIPPKFYALPKIHKSPLQLRPIVSCINSPNYNLSKYLSELLSPFRNRYNYNLNNAHQLIEHINNEIPTLNKHDKLISLDVQSLFTSIPLDMARDITKALWSTIYINTQISKQLFYNIVDFCLDNTYFSYNNTLYTQKEGLPMGDPLSPIIADLVLDKVFKDIIPKFKKHIKYCKKYVDDTIFIIHEDHIDKLLKSFNTYHTNLNFTIETENNNSLPFLDIKIIKQPNGTLTYKHYTKPTYSGRLLNFFSHQPYTYKRNCAQNFIHQTFNLTHTHYHTEKTLFIKNILLDNNYPLNLINKLIHDHHNKTHNTTPPQLPMTNNTHPNQYHSLSYIKNTSDKIKKLFTKFPHIKIAQKSPSTLKSKLFTKIKDPTPKLQKSNIVYKIPCKDCNQTYIGISSQTLKSRLHQHMSDTNKKPTSTALSEHINNTKHTIDTDKAKILHVEKHNKKRLTLEMIYIKSDLQSMNKKQDTNQLNNIYSNIISLSNKKK